ncbi:hypothetical protein [Kluyvera georgiana]|uniref:hypothetical protein n=1 Tax=Kluyvera georgiana TaxID=73098 RepID=UPI003F66E791
MSNKYEDLIKNARMNADCGEHMSPAEVTTLLNVVETTFAALAAENAEMRSSIDATIGWQESTDHENVESVRMLFDIKTSDTDAFLAEVRAQGVEMFGQYHNFSEKLFIQKESKKFAAQLRKGAAL